jgi:uncharacterized RDD family membrane protein YckC
MNLESKPANNIKKLPLNDEIEFDFRPITSGLGFHTNQKVSEVKPSLPMIDSNSVARTPVTRAIPTPKESFYQNDLSIFYGTDVQNTVTPEEKVKEKVIREASASQRAVAYLIDFSFILCCLSLVMTVMAGSVGMDLTTLGRDYTNEVTPLIIILFAGFYLLYFSIFEKTSQSTLGKYLLGITVVSQQNKSLSLISLVLRTSISLLSFVSFGLFSFFDLPNKIVNSKVVRTKDVFRKA